MSNSIPAHRVQQYSANVYHLVQQKMSKFSAHVRHEIQKSKRKFYDSYGSVEMVEKTGRHSQTPQIDTPHERRACTMVPWHWADLIDEEDEIQMIHSPKSQYAKAAAFAANRRKDSIIIGAIMGTTYSGEEGTTANTVPNTRKIAATNGVDALDDLNENTLRFAKYYFDKEEVEDKLIMAVSAKQLHHMLGREKITSADYAAIKALINGEINAFMGFTFIMSERLQLQVGELKFNLVTGAYDASGTDAAGAKICLAWAKENIILATGIGVKTRFTERDDLSYAQQVYVNMMMGGCRLEEKKVLFILCTES